MPKGFYVHLREPCATEKCGYVERRWRISRARLPQNQHERNWGRCCHESRSIVIHTPLSDEDYWATLWHEILHVALPDSDESAILRAEFSLLAACRRAGLFRDEDD